MRSWRHIHVLPFVHRGAAAISQLPQSSPAGPVFRSRVSVAIVQSDGSLGGKKKLKNGLTFFLFYFSLLCFGTVSVAQIDLKLIVFLLPQLPKCWGTTG